MIYLDTSAFLKLYMREAGSDEVNALVTSQDDPLPLWELQHHELLNALRLKVFWREITARQSENLIELLDARLRRGQYFVPEIDRAELSLTFRMLCRETPKTGCRTLDILHVACALQLAPAAFLTFDDRQRQLAARAGLRVLPIPPHPGAGTP